MFAMSNEALVWTIGGLAAFFTMWSGAGTAIAFSFGQRIARLEGSVESLNTTVERFLESNIRSAAKALHRDDDKYKTDHLLERLRKKYNKGLGDLTVEEWSQLEAKLIQMENDPELDNVSKAFAEQLRNSISLLRDVTEHKQQRMWEARKKTL